MNPPAFPIRVVGRLALLILVSLPSALPAETAPATGRQVDTVLLFGFGPFAGRNENASWLSVKQFSKGTNLRSTEVPVVWGEPRKVLHDALKHTGRVLLVALGEGDDSIQVETVGCNMRGEIRDEIKNLPSDLRIEASGPEQRRLVGPADALVLKLTQAGFPARISSDAGRFLCNEMLYELLRVQQENSQVAGVFFIHVPVLDSTMRGPDGKPVTADRTYCELFGQRLVKVLQEIYSVAEVGPGP